MINNVDEVLLILSTRNLRQTGIRRQLCYKQVITVYNRCPTIDITSPQDVVYLGKKNEATICHFYRAMHFSAKRGIAIARRLSVCPSVCLPVTLVNCDHMGWNSSKIISPLVSLGCSLFATPTWRVCSKGNAPKFGRKVTEPLLI